MAEKEYIEREALLAWAREFYPNDKQFASAVMNAPKADVQEVNHGKWETIIDAYGHIEGWLHKECGRQVTSKDEYCPHCGAKMELRNSEND